MPIYRNRNTGREHTRETPSPLLDASPRFELVDDEPEPELEPELDHHDQEVN